MRRDTRLTITLLGALAILGWAWALWLLVRPAGSASEVPPSAERWLVAYTAPSGVPHQVDHRLVPALAALASVSEGAQLVNGLAVSGTVVLYAALPLDEGAASYDLRAEVIALHPDLIGADPRTPAALLAHEAQHAWDEYSGRTAEEEQRLGLVGACVAGEERATRVELAVWERLVGPAGKAVPASGYEETINAALAEYRAGAEGFWAVATAEHRSFCEARAVGQ
jgi:hypothetical protein